LLAINLTASQTHYSLVCRVYDALNVLMAMDIISKEKKEIMWCGLPSNAHRDLDILKRERDSREVEVEKKRETLKELVVQQIGFKRLCERNRLQEEGGEGEETNDDNGNGNGNNAASNSTGNGDTKGDSASEEKIHLPFIVVNTSKNTIIQCEMGTDRTDVFFNFSEPFEINDDNEILRRLGMQKASNEFLQKSLPKELYDYCNTHNMLDVVINQGIDSEDDDNGNGNGHGNIDMEFIGEKGKGGLDALLQQL